MDANGWNFFNHLKLYKMASTQVSNEINVGLNGVGRIGKCLLMQMTKDPRFRIRAINCSSLSAHQYADYLSYDSSHKFAVRLGLQRVEVLSPTRIRIITDHSTNDVTLFSSRDPAELPWRKYCVPPPPPLVFTNSKISLLFSFFQDPPELNTSSMQPERSSTKRSVLSTM